MDNSLFNFSTPIGILRLELADAGLQSCFFVEQDEAEHLNHPIEIQLIKGYLQSYFETGILQNYPIDPSIGTSFQQNVCTLLGKGMRQLRPAFQVQMTCRSPLYRGLKVP